MSLNKRSVTPLPFLSIALSFLLLIFSSGFLLGCGGNDRGFVGPETPVNSDPDPEDPEEPCKIPDSKSPLVKELLPIEMALGDLRMSLQRKYGPDQNYPNRLKIEQRGDYKWKISTSDWNRLLDVEQAQFQTLIDQINSVIAKYADVYCTGGVQAEIIKT